MHPYESSAGKSSGRKLASSQNNSNHEDINQGSQLGQRMEGNDGSNVWNQERIYFEPLADKLEGFGSIFAAPADTQLGIREKSPDLVLSQCEEEMARLKSGLLEVRKNEVVTYWEMYRIQTVVNRVLTGKVEQLQRQLSVLTRKPCVRCGQILVPASFTAGKVHSVIASKLLSSQAPLEIETRPRTPGSFLDTVEAAVALPLQLRGCEPEDTGNIVCAPQLAAPAPRFGGIPTSGIKRPAESSVVPPIPEKSSHTSSRSEPSSTCSIPPLTTLTFRIPKVSAKPLKNSSRLGSGESCSGPVEWREPAAVCNSETEQENSPAHTEMDIETDTELPSLTQDHRGIQLESGLQNFSSAFHQAIGSTSTSSNASRRLSPSIKTSSMDSESHGGETDRPELSKLLSSKSTLRTQAPSEARQRKPRYQDDRRRSRNGRCDSESNFDRDHTHSSRAQGYSGNLITVQDSNNGRDVHKSRFWNSKTD